VDPVAPGAPDCSKLDRIWNTLMLSSHSLHQSGRNLVWESELYNVFFHSKFHLLHRDTRRDQKLQIRPTLEYLEAFIPMPSSFHRSRNVAHNSKPEACCPYQSTVNFTKFGNITATCMVVSLAHSYEIFSVYGHFHNGFMFYLVAFD